MEGNMKRYLAMVEWQLRNLPKDRRTQVIKDIRYEMELKKLQQGLTEDELILDMPTPRQLALEYGGLDTPLYAQDVPSAKELEKRARQEEEEAQRQQKREEEKAQRKARRQEEKDSRKAACAASACHGNPLMNILKFAFGLYLFFAILRAAPSVIGGLFGLFAAFLSMVIVVPMVFGILGFVFQIVFGVLGAVFKAIFRGFA